MPILLDMEALHAIADRRDHLCRHPPRCPRCDTEQVQLLNQKVPASWRCRRCRCSFEQEPPPTKGETTCTG